MFAGTIKNWNPEKKWGFIECAKTHEVYGKDIFVMGSAMPAGAAVNRGDQVSFTVQPGNKGPEAAQVSILSQAAAAPSFAGIPGMATLGMAAATPRAPTPMMQPPTGGCGLMQPPGGVLHSAHAAPKMQQPAYGLGTPIVQNAADIAAGVFVGQCKNWNPDKGWGFITCDVTERIYGKDIFVMRSAVASGNLTPGERVRFTVQSGIKGIEAASVQSEGMGGQGMMNSAMGYTSPAVVGPGQGQMFFGIVKGFNEEKGWGHIDCDGSKKLIGKDMFFMRSALNGQSVAIGSQVSFKVAQGQKGPEAAEISVLPPGTIAQSGVAGATFSGSIKIFNEEKGWGFIQAEEVTKIFGKDIFVHSKELSGYTPTVGEEVTFSVIINADGRPEASTVQLGHAAFKGFQAAPQMAAPGMQQYAPY